jgi:hypothetical protein
MAGFFIQFYARLIIVRQNQITKFAIDILA